MILTIRTDNPKAEVGLFRNKQEVDYLKWQADRELSAQLHRKIADMLLRQKCDWRDIEGVVFFEGPGSFTGLRIGASLVNVLANDLDIPATQATGEKWIKDGIGEIFKHPSARTVVPNYGRPPRITKPRK